MMVATLAGLLLVFGAPRVIRRVSELPAPLVAAFHGEDTPLSMANPGQPYQEGCTIVYQSAATLQSLRAIVGQRWTPAGQ